MTLTPRATVILTNHSSTNPNNQSESFKTERSNMQTILRNNQTTINFFIPN